MQKNDSVSKKYFQNSKAANFDNSSTIPFPFYFYLIFVNKKLKSPLEFGTQGFVAVFGDRDI
jgi:hypothetical protein